MTIAHRMASPPSEDGEEDPLLQEAIGGGDLQNREYKWYALDALSQGASFELRISYPATVILCLNFLCRQIPKK